MDVEKNAVIKPLLSHCGTQVSNRFIAENVLSEVDDVIGTVKYNLSTLCTSESIDLYALFIFIASQTVRIDITVHQVSPP